LELLLSTGPAKKGSCAKGVKKQGNPSFGGNGDWKAKPGKNREGRMSLLTERVRGEGVRFITEALE